MSGSGRWRTIVLVIVGIIAIGLLARACGSSGENPTAYVKATYERTESLDEDGIAAYVARDKTPQQVASDISANAEPTDRRTSNAGGEEGVFLQYRNHIVAIFPYQGGSRIMLGEYRRAHSHWFVYVGSWWGSSPGYGGGGSGTRGGGGGSGK